METTIDVRIDLDDDDEAVCENEGFDGIPSSYSCFEECESSGDGEDAGSGCDDRLTPVELGRRGESAAVRFLERRGFEILERNWKCRFGEADIIAQTEDGTIVFVEVKTRSSIAKGFPSEAVDEEKRARYERIAACYLLDFDVVDVPVRFDVVALLVVGSDRALVKHHINAFSAGC